MTLSGNRHRGRREERKRRPPRSQLKERKKEEAHAHVFRFGSDTDFIMGEGGREGRRYNGVVTPFLPPPSLFFFPSRLLFDLFRPTAYGRARPLV